jgi:uncharacterized repeat protein (TIGR01451 family)
MTHKILIHTLFGRAARRYWPAPATLILVALALFAHHGALAAPRAQTVPPAPTNTPTSVPQATNTPRPDGEDNQPPPATGTASQPQGEALTGVVNVDRLNLRLGPGTSFGVLGVLLRDQTVRILERDDAGAWWRVCCLANTTTEGWASAQYIRPDFDPAQANTLIPLAGSAATPTPATPISAGSTPTATVAASSVTTPSLDLELIISQTPDYVWQGQEFALEFDVTNLGNTAATNIELRNELPPEFTFVSADIDAEGLLAEERSDQERLIFSVRWPSLDAGATVRVTVRLQVAENVPDGAVIDNLAVAAADNALPFTAGITIGMPPASPPDFQ